MNKVRLRGVGLVIAVIFAFIISLALTVAAFHGGMYISDTYGIPGLIVVAILAYILCQSKNTPKNP